MRIDFEQLIALENWSPPIEPPSRVLELAGDGVTPGELVTLARGGRITPAQALCAIAYLALGSDAARSVAIRVADQAATVAGVRMYQVGLERPSYSLTRDGGNMHTYHERLALWESRHGADGGDALVRTLQCLARDRPDPNGALAAMHWDPCWWWALELAAEAVK
jgi:hypothetical protein